MPIDELMSMYGYPSKTVPETSVQKKKKGHAKKCRDKKRKVI